jgi:hypothetical protein
VNETESGEMYGITIFEVFKTNLVNIIQPEFG